MTTTCELKPKYVFSSGATLSPSQYQAKENRVLFSYRESEEFFFIVSFENNTICHIIYDKLNRSTIKLKSRGLKNDMDFGPNVWPREIIDEQIFDVISPGDLIEHEKENRNDAIIHPLKSNYNNIISKISIDDNPIIRVVHLK